MSTEPTLRLDNAAEISTSLQLLFEHGPPDIPPENGAVCHRKRRSIYMGLYSKIHKYRALLSFYARKPIEGKTFRDIRLDRNGNVFSAGKGKKEGDRGTREEVRRRKRCSPMNSRASFNNT